MRSAYKIISASIISVCLSGNAFIGHVNADSENKTYVTTTGPESGDEYDVYYTSMPVVVTTAPDSSREPVNPSDLVLPEVTEAPLETTEVSFTSPRILAGPETTTLPMFLKNKPSQYYYSDLVFINGTSRICIYGIPHEDEVIEIPAQINGKTVTTLGGGLFGHRNVKTLYLPDTIDFINTDTFLTSTKITDIYYQGSKEQWDKIHASDYVPDTIEIHCNSKLTQYGVNNDKIEYRSNGTYVEITGCPRDIKKADIPSEIGGLPVTKIGKCAFEGCQYLENVTIPESVKEVGEYAFNACKALKKINYKGNEKQWNNVVWNDTTTSDSVKEIIKFEGSVNSDTVSTPEVTQAPSETTAVSFTAPRILTAPATTTMPFSQNKPSQYYYGNIFYLNKTSKMTVFGISPDDEVIEIPAQINGKPVTTIGGGVFSGSEKVKTLYLPDTLDFINTDTFLKATKITDIYYQGNKEQWDKIQYSNYVPDGIEIHYGSELSQYGVNNDKIEYRSNGTYIEITGCPRDIKKADIPSEIGGLPVTKIGKCAFEGCQYLENVTIPESVKEVGAYAFNACQTLKNINYKGSQKQWGNVVWNDTTTKDSVKDIISYEGDSKDKEEIITGDLNGDKIVSASDLVIMQQYLLGGQTPESVTEKKVDVNSDGKINVLDLIMLKQMFLNKSN